MAEPASEQLAFNESTTNFYDPKKIERSSLEELLTFMIRILETEIGTVMGYIESYRDVDEYVSHILEMINSMEIIQMHSEFILRSLATKTSDEFQALKEEFPLIKKEYEQINSKEDLTPVPAKYVIATLYDKVIVEYRRNIQECFKKNSHGETHLVKNEDNLARLKIIRGRFGLVQEHFSQVVTFPKDDIFCYEKSSPVWQDLYRLATFKEIITKQEMVESSYLFNFFLYFSHLIIRSQVEHKALPYPKAMFSLCQDVVYYGVQRAKVETQALLYLLNPDVQEVFRAWNLAENPWIAKYYLGNLPSVGYDERIYVPRLFPAITKEVILKEYEDNTINKLCPMDPSQFQNIHSQDNKTMSVEEIFTEHPSRVPIRLISYDNLNLQKSGVGMLKDLMHKAKRVITGPDSNMQQDDQTIVVHIHGGGFVSTSSATHRVYLNKWARSLKLIHFSIDYRLAPRNQYPDALDDVWQAYLWIVNHATTVLGIKTQKIILVGDSAGGNLAVALMYRLARAGLALPHGCVLVYPALYVNSVGFSPSYFESLDDPMLPYPILKLVVKAYVGDGFKNLEDPFISPLLGSPELLEKLPPIRMITAMKDPLYDDSWRFVAKLKKLNKDIKLNVHSHLSHGFLSHKDLKHHDLFAEEICEFVRELSALNPQNSQ